jgi:hypothetical protein
MLMLELIFNQTAEDLFYITLPLFYIVGMVFLFVGIPLLIYLYKRKIPKAARTLIWSGLRREPPLLLCHDSGRGELTTFRERKGEGIVLTAQNKYKILPRWRPKLPFSALMKKLDEQKQAVVTEPQQTETEEKGEEEVQSDGAGSSPATPQAMQLPQVNMQTVFNVQFLKENFVLDYDSWISKRTFLVGLDLPFYVGYTGKLCLLNPEALALYEAGEMYIQTEDQILFNPNKVEGKSIENAFQPLLLMDPRKIQQIINEGFDQSQIAGVVADSEELARIGQGMSQKTKIILAILVIALVAGAALFILPQIMGGNKQEQTQPQMIMGFLKYLFRK